MPGGLFLNVQPHTNQERIIITFGIILLHGRIDIRSYLCVHFTHYLKLIPIKQTFLVPI